MRNQSLDEDLVGLDLSVFAFHRELGSLLVFVDQCFKHPERVADHFRIGRRFHAVLQALQPLHGLRRHFQLDADV